MKDPRDMWHPNHLIMSKDTVDTQFSHFGLQQSADHINSDRVSMKHFWCTFWRQVNKTFYGNFLLFAACLRWFLSSDLLYTPRLTWSHVAYSTKKITLRFYANRVSDTYSFLPFTYWLLKNPGQFCCCLFWCRNTKSTRCSYEASPVWDRQNKWTLSPNFPSGVTHTFSPPMLVKEAQKGIYIVKRQSLRRISSW